MHFPGARTKQTSKSVFINGKSSECVDVVVSQIDDELMFKSGRLSSMYGMFLWTVILSDGMILTSYFVFDGATASSAHPLKL